MRERTHVLPLWLLFVCLLTLASIVFAQSEATGVGFVFTRTALEQRDGVYVYTNELIYVAPDGSETSLTDVTSPDFHNDSLPIASPDGSKIAFNYGFHLAVINADGTNRREYGNELYFDEVHWSPDSRLLVVVYQSEIYILDVESGDIVAQRDDLFYEQDGHNPTFMPDGQHIILSIQNDIWQYDLDLEPVVNLTNTPDTGEYMPSIAPDGQSIAYVLAYFNNDNGFADVFVMNVDGSNPRNISNSGLLDIAGLFSPLYWSPDSTHLILDDFAQQYLYDVATGETVDLDQTSGGFTDAVWLSDGSGILVTQYTGAVEEGGFSYPLFDLYHLAPDGSNPQLVYQDVSSPIALLSPTSEAQVVAAEPSETPVDETAIEPTAEATMTPTDEPEEVSTAPQEIAYGDVISGTLDAGQSLDYEFRGQSGDMIRLELEGDDVCYRFVSDGYQFSADADGDLYYGLQLPLNTTYTLTLEDASGEGAEYSFTVVHDLAYEYGLQGILAVGGIAEVYTEDEGLKLRAQPSTSDTILETMPSGTLVEIFGGPYNNEGYVWWNVRAPSGNEGWSVESADGIQTLNPVAYPIIPPDIFPPIPCP